MLNIFRPNEQPIRHHYSYLTDIDKYQEVSLALQGYYRLSNRFVRNNHPLSVLIKQSDNTNTDVDEYLRVGLERARRVINRLGFTSENDYGSVLKGVFGDDKVHDIVITIDQSPSFLDKQLLIEDMHPLTVLSHPYMYLDPVVLNGQLGTYIDTDKSPPILSVMLDIGMLLLKWFTYRRMNKSLDINSNVNMFVHNYVLADAMESFTNVSAFNQVYLNNIGKKIPVQHYKHPLVLPSDLLLVERHSSKKSQKSLRVRSYRDIVNNVPSVSDNGLMGGLSMITDLTLVQQNSAATMLAVLPILDKLLVLSDKKSVARRDKSNLNNILIHIDRIFHNKNMDRYVKGDIYTYAIQTLHRVKSTIESF